MFTRRVWMLRSIIKSNKYLLYAGLFFVETLIKIKRKCFQLEDFNLLKQIEEDGIAVLPSFLSSQECDLLIKEYERFSPSHGHQFDNDRRIYGIEKISPIFSRVFSSNQKLDLICSAYLGEPVILQTTMSARIVAAEDCLDAGSGGGWHRDSFSKQFKAIVYLCDVNMDNGPFMYIKSSHKLASIRKVLFGLKKHKPSTGCRYTKKEMDEVTKLLGKEITYCTGKRGDVILADTRGIHTGMPLNEGMRYAATNYYIGKTYYKNNNDIETLGTQK